MDSTLGIIPVEEFLKMDASFEEIANEVIS
jgi:hypothetical protein